MNPEIDVPVFQLDAIFAGEDPALDIALSMPQEPHKQSAENLAHHPQMMGNVLGMLNRSI